MIACCFGAGGIKGAVYANALAKMQQMPQPSKIAGVSVGALVSLAYASDRRKELLEDLHNKVLEHNMVVQPFGGLISRVALNMLTSIDDVCPFIEQDLENVNKLKGVESVRVAACRSGEDYPAQVEFKVCEGSKVTHGDVQRAKASAAVQYVFDNVTIDGVKYCDGASGGCSMPMKSLQEFYDDKNLDQLWVFSTKPWVTLLKHRTQHAASRLKSNLAKQQHVPLIVRLSNWWLPKAVSKRVDRAWPAFCAYDQLQTQTVLRTGSGEELENGVCIFSKKHAQLAARWNEQIQSFEAVERFAEKPFIVLAAPAKKLYNYGDLTFMNCAHENLSALDAAASDMRKKLDAATRFVSAYANQRGRAAPTSRSF